MNSATHLVTPGATRFQAQLGRWLSAHSLRPLAKRKATIHYGAGARTFITVVRMAASTYGLRPRLCHFSSST